MTHQPELPPSGPPYARRSAQAAGGAVPDERSPLAPCPARRARATILVVDDSAAVRARLRAALEGQGLGEVIEADDGLSAFKVAVARRPDLVVCDLVMPRFDGFRYLALRASHAAVAAVPVIMLTAEDDVDRKVQVLDRGASDYVTKPFHDAELVARARVHLRLKQMQDELVELNARLEALSNTDALTGLYNRRHLERILSHELARAARYATPVSLVMADLDHFKRINDTYGHAAGDEIIRSFARVVSGIVRETDTVARFGGEELVIVAPETRAASAAALTERIRAAFAAKEHQLGGAAIRATASFGVACVEPAGQQMTPESLLARADRALYRAKGLGRDRVVVGSSSSWRFDTT